MTSISLATTPTESGRLRPLNVLRDLPQVADLIELCFEMTMDEDGQSYLHQMRRASGDKDFLSWAGRMMDTASMPISGYVWEEGGKIVGNASLVFQPHRGQKIAMIANVATHPSQRRRGIGRALTEKAVQGARQKGCKEIWLQVRDDNAGALRMYEALGFKEEARRTTYRWSAGQTSPMPAGAGEPTGGSPENQSVTLKPPAVARRVGRQWWPEQHEWLQRAHPDELGWYWRWDWNTLGPGLRNTLQRMLTQLDTRQWAAASDGRLLASVSWIPPLRTSNVLWVAAPRSGGERGIRAALEAAKSDLAHYPKLIAEYPEGESAEAFRAAGFEPYRTLIWMRADATDGPAVRRQAQKES
jgi:ribosomal protein S18 acetylase RimI-like enzyme